MHNLLKSFTLYSSILLERALLGQLQFTWKDFSFSQVANNKIRVPVVTAVWQASLGKKLSTVMSSVWFAAHFLHAKHVLHYALAVKSMNHFQVKFCQGHCRCLVHHKNRGSHNQKKKKEWQIMIVIQTGSNIGWQSVKFAYCAVTPTLLQCCGKLPNWGRHRRGFKSWWHKKKSPRRQSKNSCSGQQPIGPWLAQVTLRLYRVCFSARLAEVPSLP